MQGGTGCYNPVEAAKAALSAQFLPDEGKNSGEEDSRKAVPTHSNTKRVNAKRLAKRTRAMQENSS